jgi:hypothetical protein
MLSVMKKSHLVLFIGGALVATGMLVSFYGSKLVTEDLTISEVVLGENIQVELIKELDPLVALIGVFVVHVEELEEGTELMVAVFDPDGRQIASRDISEGSTEGQFEIGTKGSYKVLLKNPKQSHGRAVIGLTHMPDKSYLALNILGQSLIVSGFIGLGIAVIYEIKNRKKVS